MSAFTDWEKELEAADTRTKAAALRLSVGYPDEAKYYVTEAQTAIEAADEVMFSEAAIERAAKALFPSYWEPEFYHEHSEGTGKLMEDSQLACVEHVRAVVAALREEA